MPCDTSAVTSQMQGTVRLLEGSRALQGVILGKHNRLGPHNICQLQAGPADL